MDDLKYLTNAFGSDARREKVRELLTRGEITLEGMVPWSSNYTYLVTIKCGDVECSGIYKPQCGERPLWDFEDGSLCKREVAAYELSAYLGFPNIPVTVLRADGPQGLGMVQQFIDHQRRENFFTLRDKYRAEMQKIAVFDALVNNTDRKGGHVLVDARGAVWSIDHGVTFHQDPKLRTVIWDFVDEPIPAPLITQLEKLRAALKSGDTIRTQLESLLARSEVRAVGMRLIELLRARVYPSPPEDWPHIPWPPV
ncbi:MAG: SCO1664 family protein [Chloroflexi bacterium]|nr:SCO1664 family protein [Chloroflexota bacterium]